MRQHCLLKLAACSTLSHHTTDRHCMEGFTGAGVRPAELSGLSTVLLQWPLAAVQRTNLLAAVLHCIDRQYTGQLCTCWTAHPPHLLAEELITNKGHRYLRPCAKILGAGG